MLEEGILNAVLASCLSPQATLCCLYAVKGQNNNFNTWCPFYFSGIRVISAYYCLSQVYLTHRWDEIVKCQPFGFQLIVQAFS